MQKKWISYIAWIMILCLTLCGCAEQEFAVQTDYAPFGTFSAADINGNIVDQTVFAKSKLTMVNIWGTFCRPCIDEMPALAELDTNYGAELQVIGIVIDAADKNGNPLSQQKTDAISIIQSTGADYLHLIPSPSLISQYLHTVTAVPVTVFVDEEGRQVGELYLGAKEKQQWKTIIDGLLNNLR